MFSSRESTNCLILSITFNVSNMSKESIINFNPNCVCKCKQSYRELVLHLEKESLGFDNVGEFCGGFSSQI